MFEPEHSLAQTEGREDLWVGVSLAQVPGRTQGCPERSLCLPGRVTGVQES